MYILKNAYISIARNKGRNILIGSIILVIACACTIVLAINNTATDLINSYKSAYDKELTITFDRSNMKEQFDFSNEESKEEAKEKFNNINSYTVEDIKNFAKSKHIKSYYYTYSISLSGSSIEKAELSNDDKNNMPDMKENKDMPDNSALDFTVTGYNTIEAMSEFINGTYTMSEIKDNAWDIAFSGNYVFINEELAEYNNLELGNKITLKDEDENTYEFEIIGIYKENEDSTNTQSNKMDMFSSSANTIITNADALVNIANENENINANISPTFIIDSYKNKDKIQEEFYEKGLDENYVVETNEEQATSGLQSVKNVKSFAITFLIITLVIGGVVLVILNLINIRERKYEIGVFRTIGFSKLKLTLQFVSELMIIAIVALTLGAGLGAMLSKSVSNSLLENEIKSTTTQKEDMKQNFGGNMKGDFKEMPNMPGTANVQAYETIDAIVNAKVLLELFGIGILLVLVSSASAMISIQRFSPLTILKERS